MKQAPFEIDERLLADNHVVYAADDLVVLLNRCAALPWLVIVPNGLGVNEWFELPQLSQRRSFELAMILGQWLKADLGCDKINTAAIGNVVSQLHIHVVGRKHDDSLWPDLVWGASMPDAPYSESTLAAIREQLSTLCQP